jgi:hypothetical protein
MRDVRTFQTSIASRSKPVGVRNAPSPGAARGSRREPTREECYRGRGPHGRGISGARTTAAGAGGVPFDAAARDARRRGHRRARRVRRGRPARRGRVVRGPDHHRGAGSASAVDDPLARPGSEAAAASAQTGLFAPATASAGARLSSASAGHAAPTSSGRLTAPAGPGGSPADAPARLRAEAKAEAP